MALGAESYKPDLKHATPNKNLDAVSKGQK